MNAPAVTIPPTTEIGTPFEGGFYVGTIRVNDVPHILIVSPAAQGDHDDVAWSASRAHVDGATSFNDGRANTEAMAAAGSKLARWALALDINGHTDWYLPARDELELLYRHLKPTAETNWCWRGDNPSSIPVGYAYSRGTPAQTSVEAFQQGGPEALRAVAYWSSTQYAGGESNAWCQGFDVGYQCDCRKVNELRARAVRRLPI
ncbi:MAG TPA: DUF1566 domain-containing protein [Burkholderiaceae bacterium]|nr:DUF1566 domain-containing protein [Burkholderiaceae bacterium]